MNEQVLTKILEKLENMDQRMARLEQNQARMENELTDKVRVLFDAREVQNDVNERILDSLANMQTDLNYLVAKSAQQSSEISRIKKTRKSAKSL